MIINDAEFIALVVLLSFLNRARGSQFWNLIPSTTFSRLLATLYMTIGIVGVSGNIWHLALWPLLYLWSVPAWDSYWSAEIGHDVNHSKLWGTSMMSLRMILLAPAIIGSAYLAGNLSCAWLALTTPLLSLPYYAMGVINKNNPIPYAEHIVGALMGIIFFFTL